MDVTCERCSTEYEFDDALVSERGTTVKCTNCGYQFKVRRSDGSLPEAWLVRTVDGRELEFRMLRELQGAITHGQITRDDVLSRGSSRPRRLGSIAELEPFFTTLGGMLMMGTVHGIGGPSPLPGRTRTLTPQGLGGPAPGQTEGSIAIPLPRPDPVTDRGPDSESDSETVVMDTRPGQFSRVRPSSRSSASQASAGPETTPLGRGMLASGGLPGVVVPPEEAPPLPNGFPGRKSRPRAPAGGGGGGRHRGGAKDTLVEDGTDTSTLPAGLSPLPELGAAPPRVEVTSAPAAAHDEGDALPTRRDATSARAAGEARAARRQSAIDSPVATPTAPGVRSSYFDDGYGDPRFTSLSPPKRIGVFRWIVGFVIAGLAAVAVVTLGARYLPSTAPGRAQVGDERVPVLLGEGERSLADGDLDTARDKFVKASALAEDDPRVAERLARLETVTADARWLRLQLLAVDDTDLEMAKLELKTAIDRARKAVEHARRVAPKDAAVTRATIDLLRIEGDLAGARKLVGSISVASAQPENALTLAGLDLAEAQPSWAAVIERLRTAASGEHNLGRARTLLIYALARSGELIGARAELDRLFAMRRQHPLARPLRSFLESHEKGRARAAGDAAGSPGASAGGGPTSAAQGNVRSQPTPAAGGPSSGRVPRGLDADAEDGRVPDDYVAPGGIIDTSDLPGVHAPSTAPPSASKSSPQVDTSDLPGSGHD
jgi:predicted Zn finger-like uncharacterized protein